MRKLNSKFTTNFISEAGAYIQNRDYFAFVELDKFACYVVADGIDEDKKMETAKIAVTAFIKRFTEKPSMNKFIIKKYLKEVNEEVIDNSRNSRLKASITVVVSNYNFLRYYTIGNTRFYLFKDGYLKLKSKDESLTQDLADKELISLDKMARHIERNNLKSYLGQDKIKKIDVSKKIKLNDKDVFAILTRGIWENCDDNEMEEALEGVESPKEAIDNVEDIILSKQPKDLQNYTLAMVFAEKVYVNPEKKKLIKRIIIIAVIVVILLIVLIIVLQIMKNRRLDAIADVKNYEESAENYLSNDNVQKANEEYKSALNIAKLFGLIDELGKLDGECKYTDLIIQADGYLDEKKYVDALDKYTLALEKSSEFNSIGREYINKKIYVTKNCITVADLLILADKQLEDGDDKSAESNYIEAKRLSLDIYLKDEKQEAMDKLQKIYDDRAKAAEDAKAADDAKAAEDKEAAEKEEADKKAAEEEVKAAEEEAKKEEEDKAKAEDEAKKAAQDAQAQAIDLRKSGDLSYVSGDYVNAKMYYSLAKEAFESIGSNSLAGELEEKISLMDVKIQDSADVKAAADKYREAADGKCVSNDLQSAKILYMLAKENYESLGLVDESAKIDEKIKALG